MCLGSHLKKIREEKKMSQQEVADLIGISQKTLSNMESGKTIPNIFQLVKIKEIYNVDLLEILEKERIYLTNPPPRQISLNQNIEEIKFETTILNVTLDKMKEGRNQIKLV
ncbi:DNA-binding transcriptional regulator, XRE-family HTH domain [Algoriphagus ornithinivorans]|uniref:DNA-binding transcriptional regulator, XRE-family HTH domain n=1 Tax=Algoriphagus ornithinivorans TaxID=226506 RepID=A0A1I5EYX8_9BACT|nr:helix-turn-helix transcriptional regulator [Algoriphagus ornithinivorans]SFO16712.1 DNA-binding transcriptional regulator, XRE-family HTH domain [Algoriphagus ornithinivorans]